MTIIDAHTHLWRLSRGDYGWLDGKGGPLDPLRRDFDRADYPGDGRLILVQAAETEAETDYLLSIAEGDPMVAGVVGWIDLSAPDAIARIEARAATPILKGVRPVLQDIAETNWLEDAVAPETLDALAASGLRFDALVTARHLPMLARIAAQHPDLPLIIDHAAKAQNAGTDADWQEGMAALAALPHVHCKLSGLLTELPPEALADPLPALRPMVGRLLDWFGAERLVWGSDWPVLTLAASWQEWRALTDELLAPLPDASRDAILRGNAARFYGVAP